MRVWIAIWVGSGLISRRICAWLAGGVAPIVFLVLAAAFIKGLSWTTRISVLAAAAWLVTAIVLGLREPAPEKQRESEEATQEEPALPTRDELAAALHQIGTPHAHITALAERLGTTNERVREGCAAAGITVSGGVRMKGRRVAVSPGVDKRHFPPLPSPAQEPAAGAVVAGPLTSNNNSNNTEQEGASEGAAEIVQDETNPRRWRVLRRA